MRNGMFPKCAMGGVTLDVHKLACEKKFVGVLRQKWQIFARLVDATISHIKCGRDAVASGVCIQQRRRPLYLLTNVMVVVAAHTPCPGGGGGGMRVACSAAVVSAVGDRESSYMLVIRRHLFRVQPHNARWPTT